MQKWTNIRDAFFRSLKTKSGDSAKKNMCVEHLQFLLKFAEKADTDSNMPDSHNASELLEESQSSVGEENSNQEHVERLLLEKDIANLMRQKPKYYKNSEQTKNQRDIYKNQILFLRHSYPIFLT